MKFKQTIILVFIQSGINLFSQPETIVVHQDKLDLLAVQYGIDGYQLKKTCLRYFYLIEKNVLLKDTKEKVTSLTGYANAAYNAGEISMLEKLDLTLQFQELENNIKTVSYLISIEENKIRSLINSMAAIVPESDTLKKYTSFKFSGFVQKQENNEADSCVSDFIKIENQLLHYYLYQEKLNFFTTVKLPYIYLVEKQSLYQYNEEDIDLLTYYQQLFKILHEKTEYLNLLNDYNQLVIKIEDTYEN